MHKQPINSLVSAAVASPQDLLYDFTNAIQPVKRAWLQAAATVIAQSGVSFAMAMVIVLLSRHGDGMHQRALADAAGVNPAAMLRTLNQAETEGLCERRDVAHDSRIKAIYLLPRGKALAKRIEQGLTELRGALLGDVPVSEIEAATRILRLFEARIAMYLDQPTQKA